MKWKDEENVFPNHSHLSSVLGLNLKPPPQLSVRSFWFCCLVLFISLENISRNLLTDSHYILKSIASECYVVFLYFPKGWQNDHLGICTKNGYEIMLLDFKNIKKKSHTFVPSKAR